MVEHLQSDYTALSSKVRVEVRLRACFLSLSLSLLYATTLSITPNGPFTASPVQTLSTFHPTPSNKLLHCLSVLCILQNVVLEISIRLSKPVHPVAGRIVSQMSNFDIPGVMARS